MKLANVITSPTVFVAPINRPKVSAVRRHVIARFSNDRAEAVLSGESDINVLATIDEVGTYFTNEMIKKSHKPSTRISDIMQRNVVAANPADKIDELRPAFEKFTSLPVVRTSDHGLVGVISRKDLNKSGSVVSEVMSHPPFAAKATDTVGAAAAFMFKKKIHTLPIVDENKKCVGIVTRTDIFTAIAVDNSNPNRERLNMDR
jgi:CBS domain-containing protein